MTKTWLIHKESTKNWIKFISIVITLYEQYMLQFKRGSENIYFLKSFADFKALCVIGYYLIFKILLLYLDCIDLAYFKE